jgi:hypothetical protein
VTERVGTCDACHFGPVLLTEYPQGMKPTETKALCGLCARTLTGRLADGYSRTHSVWEHADVLRTVCFVGNAILAHLEQLYRR